MPLLEIENLTVAFPGGEGGFRAVDGVGFTLDAGEVLGVVGESGSGKSLTALAAMGLVPRTGAVTATRLAFDGRDLATLSRPERRRLNGRAMAMIFQEPMTSLNPCFTVGFQIMESLRVHGEGTRAERRRRALELLDQVGIPEPELRLRAFPHQLSGGMSQRVMIAMAIACNPRLLIADEPTTALDVTIQAQILDLLLRLQRDRGMALLLITHDLGVIAETADRIAVMYAGQVVELGSTASVLEAPRHPYTAALMAALPERATGRTRLSSMPGTVPGHDERPPGCAFHPRCGERADAVCRREKPGLRRLEAGLARCHHPLPAGTPPG